ncbi:hypothetical protein E3N88_18144 [Mikania micrantha]|uniref:SET domain-containing protein n=1 Tax=Mikania micrantha TaxID=192012 RepID=A0A5N6NWK6_9ASTR|nr:hypothetical protein E3N88_18144 [Mikania micrantha]
MAEASRIFQTTLMPSLSQTSSLRKHCSRTISVRRTSLAIIRCTISTTSSDTYKAAGAPPPISWGCEIDSLENAAALEKWLTVSGLPPQKMDIRKVDVGERGLVANNNIRKGEKLLFVPPSLVISADSEWSFPEAGEVLRRYNVPDWPLIATYLISEASLMESSRWSNYISALPRQPYSLLYWTRAELDRYLEASQIRERAIERINNVTGTYNDLRARIFSKHPNLFPEEVFNMETFKWSFGILFSRLVRLPSLDGRVALVPWADMLNHSCDVETFLDYDKSTKGVVFTTDRPYQPGEQVFISYGRKSNGELLLSYGFVPREGTNPCDSVELPLSIKKTDKCYVQKVEALKKHGLSASQCFPLQVTGWPLELIAFAYLVVSPPNMSGKFEEMASAASNKNANNKEIRYPELEEQALQLILDCCESSISKYTKFLQASGSMDLDITSPKQLNRKLFLKQLAVDLCNSEQRILFRAQYKTSAMMNDKRQYDLKPYCRSSMEKVAEKGSTSGVHAKVVNHPPPLLCLGLCQHQYNIVFYFHNMEHGAHCCRQAYTHLVIIVLHIMSLVLGDHKGKRAHYDKAGVRFKYVLKLTTDWVHLQEYGEGSLIFSFFDEEEDGAFVEVNLECDIRQFFRRVRAGRRSGVCSRVIAAGLHERTPLICGPRVREHDVGVLSGVVDRAAATRGAFATNRSPVPAAISGAGGGISSRVAGQGGVRHGAERGGRSKGKGGRVVGKDCRQQKEGRRPAVGLGLQAGKKS